MNEVATPDASTQTDVVQGSPVEQALLVSVAGIAAGLRNTG